MGEYYIGLISGTSMDGIDAVLVNFEDTSLNILQTREHAYDDDIREPLSTAMHAPEVRRATDVADLHARIGECFRDAANALLNDAGIDACAVTAIGSHGQTVRHRPGGDDPYSLQVGDPGIIAAGTGIQTIADFRRADIELGGGGAPLTPAFHEWLFREAGSLRVILNIGGIANITMLPADDTLTTGFDTGPGNTLLDAWTRLHLARPFDRDGAWAASGTIDAALLQRLLADPYFSRPPPKSTGFEHFNLDWLEAAIITGLGLADVQATLCELTAVTIAEAIHRYAGSNCELLVCGGGAHNTDLMHRIQARLPYCVVRTTAAAGLDPDWVEAVAFAWLAMRNLRGLTGNLPAVTGASHPTVLGTVHSPA